MHILQNYKTSLGMMNIASVVFLMFCLLSTVFLIQIKQNVKVHWIWVVE